MHCFSWVPSSLKRPRSGEDEDSSTPSKRPYFSGAFGGSRPSFTLTSANTRSDSAYKKQARSQPPSRARSLALSCAERFFFFSPGGHPQLVAYLAAAHVWSGAAPAWRLSPAG